LAGPFCVCSGRVQRRQLALIDAAARVARLDPAAGQPALELVQQPAVQDQQVALPLGAAAAARAEQPQATAGSSSEQYTSAARRECGSRWRPHCRSGPSKPTQLRFIELALRFHRLEDFTIIEVAVAGPSLRGAPGLRPRSACEAVERDTRRPTADQLRSNLKGLPGAWLVSNAVNFSHVEGALPGLDAARLFTG
jgi:hypothetical protein